MRQRYPVYPNILKTHFLPGWHHSKLQQFSIRHTKKRLTVVVYFNKLINFKMQVHANIIFLLMVLKLSANVTASTNATKWRQNVYNN